MGSWTTLNATYHIDISSKIKNEYIREESEELQTIITNKIKYLYKDVYRESDNSLDSDCIVSWSFNPKEGWMEFYDDKKECWVKYIHYPACILNISLWSRQGSIKDTEEFLKQLHEYFKDEMFYIYEPRSSEVYTDLAVDTVTGNAFTYKVTTEVEECSQLK